MNTYIFRCLGKSYRLRSSLKIRQLLDEYRHDAFLVLLEVEELTKIVNGVYARVSVALPISQTIVTEED